MAFCAWRRFSASRNTRDCGPSMTPADTSSPRWAGRQCRKMASGAACCMSASSTVKPVKAAARACASSSCPMDAHTSVVTTWAPAAASAGSRVTATSAADRAALEDGRVGVEALGARQAEAEAQPVGGVEPGVGHVVAVPDPRHGLALQLRRRTPPAPSPGRP